MIPKKQATIGTVIGAIILVGLFFGFGDYFKSSVGGDIATSTIATSSDSEIIIEPELSIPILPITQVEDEYFEVDDQYNKDGLLTSQSLYAEDTKLTKDKITDYKENLTTIQLQDTDLKEAEVLTLYVRGIGVGTATLWIGDTELITLTMEDKKWLTKWDSVDVHSMKVPRWTQGQINNARVEFTGKIKVSNIRLYAEDQHSLTESFESYNTGDLNGQGSWTANTGIDVQENVVQDGTKAIQIPIATPNVATKAFTPEGDGTQIYYARTTTSSADPHEVSIRDASDNQKIPIKFTSGNIQVYGVSSGWLTLQAYSVNTWYKIQVDWRTSDDKARYYVDDVLRLDWSSPRGGTWTTLGIIHINANQNYASQYSYFDSFNISAEPEEAVDSTQIIIWDED